MYNRNTLINLIREKALCRQEVTLSSGQQSTYYIDLSKIAYTNDGLLQMCYGLMELIGDDWNEIQAFGGPVLGAVPLISGLTMIFGEQKRERFWYKADKFMYYPDRSFVVRSEPKKHGKQDFIEGNVNQGDVVILLEDVTTTGGSLWKTIQLLNQMGVAIRRIVSVVDREQGAKQFFKEKGYDFTSLLTVSEIT